MVSWTGKPTEFHSFMLNFILFLSLCGSVEIKVMVNSMCLKDPFST